MSFNGTTLAWYCFGDIRPKVYFTSISIPALNGFGDVFRTLEGLGATAGGIFFCVPGESFIFRPWKLLSMPCCVIFRILYENINNIVIKQKFQPMWALSIKWQPHKCPHFDLSTSQLINIKTWSFNLYLTFSNILKT